jgi:uncharacterized membrane protein YvlD (DUF360 family)
VKLFVRAIVTWFISAVAVVLFADLIPGIHIATWASGALIVLVMALMNALVRPIILRLAVNLGLLAFALITFFLNGFLVLLSARLIPGFTVDGLWSALLFSFLLATVSTICTGMLSSDDDDTFYRSVIQRINRQHKGNQQERLPGVVLIQIDGLAEPILRRELATGHLPTLQRWLGEGSHRLVSWNCGVPSMTPGSQAGILNGNNANIPAFRWYERELGRLVVANHPKDARWIDERQSTGHGLLRDHGSSISNIFSGSAEHLVMTQSGLVNDEGKLTVASRDFYSFLESPYNLYRIFVGMVRELCLEYYQAWQQKRKRIEPRMHRGGAYPFLRAATNVLMSDATTYVIIDDMFAGRPVVYADFLGYDEVAHHAGPDTRDALRSLGTVDRKLRSLEQAARQAPRDYQFVVLSDHGQSTGATFRQRYGLTLADLVRDLVGEERPVAMSAGQGEGWSHLNILLTEMVRAGGFIGSTIRKVLPKHATANDEIELGPDAAAVEEAAVSDAVVCASGNLALLYFTKSTQRLTLEELNTRYPRLIPELTNHAGIGFLLVLSEEQGPLVLGPSGTRSLRDDAVRGDDPLAAFDPSTADYLRRMNNFINAPDVVVNSPCYPEGGQVAAYEELIGCHGGAGGLQTTPFLLFPNDWGSEDPKISGPEAMHDFLRVHVPSAPDEIEPRTSR